MSLEKKQKFLCDQALQLYKRTEQIADFESQKPNLARVLKHLRHVSKLISF